MVSYNKKTILQIFNILTPIICLAFLSLLSMGQGDFNAGFGQGEDSLIDPVGFAFAIWGPIFVFLSIFLIYQARDLFKSAENKIKMDYVHQVSIYFILSTIFTSLWYLFWIYQIIWLSTLSMILYLVSLVIGYLRLKINLVERSTKEKWAVVVPWSMYTAWVTAATIISIKTFLMSIGFNEPMFLLSDTYWAVIVLLVALVIYTAAVLTRNDYVYGGVGIWVLLGILIERLTSSEIVIEVVITAIVGMVVLLGAIIYQVMKKK
ncbi:MAG: hypothetical protein R6U96_05715 [Promethearchaeia archaeon]